MFNRRDILKLAAGALPLSLGISDLVLPESKIQTPLYIEGFSQELIKAAHANGWKLTADNDFCGFYGGRVFDAYGSEYYRVVGVEPLVGKVTCQFIWLNGGKRYLVETRDETGLVLVSFLAPTPMSIINECVDPCIVSTLRGERNAGSLDHSKYKLDGVVPFHYVPQKDLPMPYSVYIPGCPRTGGGWWSSQKSQG